MLFLKENIIIYKKGGAFMAKKLKIRNDDDKTIFELQLDDNVQNEKVKPGKILLRIFIIIAALGFSILAGYFLQKIF